MAGLGQSIAERLSFPLAAEIFGLHGSLWGCSRLSEAVIRFLTMKQKADLEIRKQFVCRL
jgi:hypothetical protein